MFTDDKAAFLLDGSWKVGGIVGSCQSDPEDPSTIDADKLSHFDVTYFPGKGNRKTTDMIGGLSMGYYITTKAWEDPDKKAAAEGYKRIGEIRDMLLTGKYFVDADFVLAKSIVTVAYIILGEVIQ